jgi:hypothetical protein
MAGFWPHSEVAGAYGVFRDISGFGERAIIVEGVKGLVRLKRIYSIKEVPDMRDLWSADTLPFHPRVWWLSRQQGMIGMTPQQVLLRHGLWPTRSADSGMSMKQNSSIR